MKRMILTTLLLAAWFGLNAGNYKSFKVAVYARAYEVEKMSNLQWLDSTWNIISSQVKVDKIYLETYRDLKIVPGETLEKAKKFFKEHGVETYGGITYTVNEMNNFETFSYSNPEHRKKVQEIAEHAAKYFDFIILDDFFFTNSKTDNEIKAKGSRSWTQYRDSVLADAGYNLVVAAAKRVNPNVKVIIKYPNWYDHFQGLGFDLNQGPKIFDGVWTGTETRNPDGAQHIQQYEGYNIFRYFDNITLGRNFGGWVDSGGIGMGMDRYVEQLWLTMFAKSPEIALFDYLQLMSVPLLETFRTPWQDKYVTSFRWDEMMQPVKQRDGKLVKPRTIARAAGWSLENIDKFVYKLGKPVGVASYKPYNSLGEDFLQNFLGMIGIPVDMVPEFPADKQVVLLTAQAAADKDILAKIKKQLVKGGDVVITSGLLKAIPEKIAEISELRHAGLALVNEFGQGGTTRDILIPKVMYHTNDAWEVVSAGRPLTNGVNGFPMLLRAGYSKGNLYVMTIPEDFGDLYELPVNILNAFRRTLNKDLNVGLEAPAKVSIFEYDNGTFILESFLDEETMATITVRDGKAVPQDLLTGETLVKDKAPEVRGFWMMRNVSNDSRFTVKMPPHSYRVFTVK